MELQDLLNEKEWRKCRGPEKPDSTELVEAFTYFCANHWTIRHPERGRIKFVLREAQIETAETWITERYSIVLKARQIGFSTLAAAFTFWETFFWPDRFTVMLSRTEREAAKLLQKTKYGYKMLPQWMKIRGPELLSDNQLKMVFANDSAIESLPSGNDPARGESVYRVVIDEMAFLPNPEEAWASIEPVADVGGRVICLSTANGEGNIFHSLWVGSQTGNNRFTGIFFPWSAGERDDEWYEAKRNELPDWQLAQEYPSNPEEAFIRSGRPVFDIDALRDYDLVPPDTGLLRDGTGRNVYDFDPCGGPLSVWEEPQLGESYVIGADVAEGLGHGDYSSAHVISAESGLVVAIWHGHIDPDLFGTDVLAPLGFYYNYALIGVESNNHGLTTIKALQRASYRKMYKQRRLNHTAPRPTDVYGWRTTATSKPLAIDELARVIRDRMLGLYCEYTIAELKTFVREDNGKTHGSPHDDRVMSLAIANQMLKHVWSPEYRQETAPRKNSLGWWERHLFKENKPERTPLGSFNVSE
jgi:hypothetical protein